jgi:group I intron endonuclease
MNNILSHDTVNLTELFGHDEQIYGIIYRITNLITGKIYIGQTKHTLEKRWKGHIKDANGSNSNQYIHNSIRKYGPDNFSIVQIDVAYDPNELNLKEELYIMQENSLSPNGYNLKSGGYLNTWCQESRDKLSKKRLEMHLTHSDELKQHWSDVKKGIPKSEEHRRKISAGNKNKPKSEEHKRKLSESLMGHDMGFWYHNPETNKKIRRLDGDEIPEGFIEGFGEANNSGFIFCHNIETGEMKTFDDVSSIPEGWKRGNPNVGLKMCVHNPETGQLIRIMKDAEIPEGFIKGSNLSSTKGLFWYHNPKTSERKMFNKTDQIPEGFIKGTGLATRKGKRLYMNNETGQRKMFAIGEFIPEGFELVNTSDTETKD